MNLANFDLNLMIIFDAIYRESSLTLAGQRLHLTQPAMSHALGRLRVAFNNPLFIRQGHQMVPTPLAEELSLNIQKIIELAQKTLEDQGSFNPKKSTRTFHVGMQDYPMMVLLPKLLKEICAAAPHIVIRVFHLSMESRKVALDDGKIELVIGGKQDFGSNINQQYLFSDREVCILRKDHPVIGESLSFDQYIHAEFVGLGISDFDIEVFDKRLGEMGHKRKVRVIVEQEVSIPHLINTTDLLANVAELVAKEYIHLLPIKILPIPIDPYQFDIFQYWHVRNHLDPAHNWLRKSIKNVCERLNPTVDR
jgi:DNA-binding transcriptional LysR family regulator